MDINRLLIMLICLIVAAAFLYIWHRRDTGRESLTSDS